MIPQLLLLLSKTNPIMGALEHVALTVAFAVIVGGVFFAAWRAHHRRHPAEQGLVAKHSETMSGTIDGFRIPFIRVAVYDDLVVIAWLGGPVLLRNGDVTGVVSDGTKLSGYRTTITQPRPGMPRTIRLYRFRSSGLDAALRKCLLGDSSSPTEAAPRRL